MRALLVSVLIFLAAPGFLRAQTKPAREQMGLLGPVRSISIEAERTDITGSTSARVPVQTIVYDEKGNVIHQDMYQPDGTLKWQLGWGHVYDNQGREVKTYYYNDKGALTNTGVSVYDSNNRRIETTQINPNGSVNHIQAFFYDDKGNKVREVHRYENGSLRNEITRSYDANGNLIEEVFSAGDGSLGQKNVFAHDGRGNETSWTVTVRGGTAQQQFRKSQSYDERGNVKEAINYRSDNSVISKETFTYEFDEHGNWIKRITTRELFRGDLPELESEVTYRAITYF